MYNYGSGGLSKNRIAVIYRREYNEQIKWSRMEMKNRYTGRYITNYEALAKIEKVIYNFLREEN